MHFIFATLAAAWSVLLESAPYLFLGLLVAGLLRVLLHPAAVARHLGQGRIRSVFKAALLGMPVPLCSCGVLPAAAALRRQGANRGATASFLIATPETGVDSIAVTYALLDPILTVARPLAAFVTAMVAGLAENLSAPPREAASAAADLSCPVDGCCDGSDCPPQDHARHHSAPQRLRAGLAYAFGELWNDLAGWFLLGLVMAGAITALVPGDLLGRHLGGGLGSLLIMLIVAVPLYVCATASTPIAAALLLKGVSPGAALVFLLAGPATNITSLTVVSGVLGKRATAIYLAAIVGMSLALGLALDGLYAWLGLSAAATVGQAGEILPAWFKLLSALGLLALSLPYLGRRARGIWSRLQRSGASKGQDCAPAPGAG